MFFYLFKPTGEDVKLKNKLVLEIVLNIISVM